MRPIEGTSIMCKRAEESHLHNVTDSKNRVGSLRALSETHLLSIIELFVEHTKTNIVKRFLSRGVEQTKCLRQRGTQSARAEGSFGR